MGPDGTKARVVFGALRAVNVGGRNKVPMAELREMLRGQGFNEVRTYLQSGNVIVTTELSNAATATAIQEVIRASWSVTTPCVILERAEVLGVSTLNPLAASATDPSRMQVILLDRAPARAVVEEHPLGAVAPTHAQLVDRFIFQWCPDGISNAPAIIPWVERRWQLSATARNMKTIAGVGALLA